MEIWKFFILFGLQMSMEVNNENQYEFPRQWKGFSQTVESFPKLRKELVGFWALEHFDWAPFYAGRQKQMKGRRKKLSRI